MPHLLKRLELNGFKSFAGKVTFEFPAGITAIVGPNGSGKSNIIDAIRWLLGEREAKSLRGVKSEDLIFAGTPKRPRVGLAQASLHFENHRKFFPVEFEEVSVARQVNRGGESEYFLNKSEVRLKDLVDFFAAARLGSKGITVITQGNSDMFIRATPEERREMIEEVLGLKEYQMKKYEAERKLKNARINLEKAEALMEEILPHLRSLKRQTGRFEKRDEYVKELRDLEDSFFGSQLGELARRLAASEAGLRAHEGRQADLAKAREEAEARLEAVEGNEPKERAELKDLKATIKSIEEKRGVLQRDLARLETRIEIAERSANAPSGISGEKLLNLVHDLQKLLEAGLGDPASLAGSVAEALRRIKALFKEAEAPPEKKKADTGGTEIEFERVSASLKQIEDQILELRDKEKTLEKSQEEFYSRFKQVLEEVQASRAAFDEWSRAEQAKTLEHERLLMRKAELERQVEQIGRRPEEFREGMPNVHPPAGGSISNENSGQEAERRMFRLRGELAAIGEIDESILKEARDTEERYQFLERESEDLKKAETDLKTLIRDLNQKISAQFNSSLTKINAEFQKFFDLMFGGGTAKLVLEDLEPKTSDIEEQTGESRQVQPEAEEQAEKKKEEREAGVEVKVSLPRKRVSSLDALSGGERSLVGIATLFALISVSPPPFLVLDEIDAPLDERNARRFAEMLREFSKETQFIIVTHNRATMEAADVLYGITLGEDGASQVVSMKFAEAAKSAP